MTRKPPTITIADDLQLPAEDFLESVTAIIAKRGRGKTGGVKVILEELCRQRLPFIAFDPAGVLWGLRSSFNGKEPSGFNVLVIGGDGGDLPLERKMGARTAQAVAESNASVIFDFNGLPKAAYREFVTDFCEELFRVNQTPRLIVVEEASRLVPQRFQEKEQARAFSAVENLVTLGRNKGLGVLLVNQRSATINKDVLTQIDRLIVMGTLSPQDRKAIREWVEENADTEALETFLDGLSTLKPREAWLWDPEHDLFRPFRFRAFTTFHPDRTHLRRHGWLELRPARADMTTVITSLGEAMRELAEKAAEDDPRALRAEIARLRAEAKAPPPPPPPEVRVEVREVHHPADVAILAKAQDALTTLAAEIHQHRVSNVKDDLVATGNGQTRPTPTANHAQIKRSPAPKPLPTATTAAPAGKRSRRERILDTLAGLAQVPNLTVTVQSLAGVFGVHPRGGSYLQELKDLERDGFIELDRDRVTITKDGRLASQPAPLPSSVEDVERSLGSRTARVFRTIANHGGPISKEDVAAALGVHPRGGSFLEEFKRLADRGLIVDPGRGEPVAVADWLRTVGVVA